MAGKHHTDNKPEIDQVADIQSEKQRYLILHNDEVHTFDYVIETLIKVCEMEPIQAEQCTFLVHYKGKCDVKKGDYGFLKPYRKGLIDKGLEATIN